MTHPLDKLIATVTAPDERDKQTRIGPSALGKQCALCLAEEMLGNKQEQTFSLYPWYGTAMHLWLEQNERDPTVETERRVEVGVIEGYGRITGTCDRYDHEHSQVGDYKLVGKNSMRTIKNGYMRLPDGRVEFIENQALEYYVQIQAYGVGMANEGFEVKTVALYLFPRDSMSVSGITMVEFPFNPDIVYAYMERAADIYEYAQAYGTEDIEGDPDCWGCRRRNYG